MVFGTERHTAPKTALPTGLTGREGNLGDHKPVGDAVSEMRLTYGSGWRLYFARRGNTLIILLCGGDKSTQDKDIKRAKALAQEV